ncbi:MAG: hypothetical protein OEN01_09440 [Candidatus Krumholzibacteria bacterium]|nr:hypothetical protein [Candidatus Krumholzibacteria bacterium]
MGINLEGPGSNNLIGGITPNLGNAITDNAADSNGNLGIDLQGPSSGVTPNDDQDPDMEANDLQNFPTLDTGDDGP